MSRGTVTFFEQKDFQGPSRIFRVGEIHHLLTGGAINAKYNSYRMDKGGYILTWNHSNGNATEYWKQNKASLDGLDYYQCFRVLQGEYEGEPPRDLVVSVKFVDNTSTDKGRFSLLLKAADVGDVTLMSNEDSNHSPIGFMPLNSTPVTTAIYVRDQSGAYPAVGSIYFVRDENEVVIRDQEGFPRNLSYTNDGTVDGESKFTIYIDSVAAAAPGKEAPKPDECFCGGNFYIYSPMTLVFNLPAEKAEEKSQAVAGLIEAAKKVSL